MKVKALKPHYYDGIYIFPNQEYFCDKIHGDKVVRLGIAKSLDKPKEKKERRPRRSKKEK